MRLKSLHLAGKFCSGRENILKFSRLMSAITEIKKQQKSCNALIFTQNISPFTKDNSNAMQCHT
jgi:hypothetical protein